MSPLSYGNPTVGPGHPAEGRSKRTYSENSTDFRLSFLSSSSLPASVLGLSRPAYSMDLISPGGTAFDDSPGGGAGSFSLFLFSRFDAPPVSLSHGSLHAKLRRGGHSWGAKAQAVERVRIEALAGFRGWCDNRAPHLQLGWFVPLSVPDSE
ncbi:hypothetical protein MAPG_03279 [Magnaporthiopsis poae ATCC 64411]|uniref:Uncharacterized protein n=1 Tax=Magnaporthiopsis poae (strain ATCC 64411 / 73-15) TaxID=644358 RepID=A0A0C4DTK9_MAGP6|nr:hypothetical protein MAPG_03279 [Magnaporthiopsis poae ATCC 64411]